MITLEKMDSSAFQSYLDFAIENYAAEHVRSGRWKEEDAISNAKKEFDMLLPEGERTLNNNLFIICDKAQEVGMIWLAQKAAEEGFIYDLNIWEENRGKGYGKKAMEELEVEAEKLGLKSIRLHVFGHNKIAHDLYKKLGYMETNIMMKKTL